MSKMIQIRNVPERMHRELKRRAKLNGQSLTEYLEDLLEREIAYPPLAEVLKRIESRKPVRLPKSAAEYVHQGRAKRTRE